MTTLRAFHAVVVELWRTWPDLLIQQINRLADDLNQWNGEHRDV